MEIKKFLEPLKVAKKIVLSEKRCFLPFYGTKLLFCPWRSKLREIKNSELANRFKTIKYYVLSFPVAEEVKPNGFVSFPDRSLSPYK